MTKPKFIDLLAFTLTTIPFIAWFLLKDSLPEKLPIHWNAVGEADGWTSKGKFPFFILIMTAFGVMTYLLLRFIKRIDPKRTAELNERVAVKVGIGIITFTTATNLLWLLPQYYRFNTATTVLVMVSLLFTFLGNVMYNIKPNYFIGIRLPWTLEDANNWKHTHRLAGVLWFIGGIVCTLLALVMEPDVVHPFFISITVLLVLIPGIYSFIFFKKMKHRQKT